MSFSAVILTCFVAVVFLCVGLGLGWLLWSGPGALGRMMLGHIKDELSGQAVTVLKAKAASITAPAAASSPAKPPA